MNCFKYCLMFLIILTIYLVPLKCLNERNKKAVLNETMKVNQGFNMILRQNDDLIFIKYLDKIISEIMGRITGEVNCLGIISDHLYNGIFKRQLFDKLKYVPYLKLLVKDNEDLKSPNYLSLKVINEIRKNGCLSYIILLANGLQMSRLLIFGDRYRVLNTRANYIFLHDFRLFDPPLHYLWKKFVNVVFLREFEGRTLGHKASLWYEVSTVPFPAPIKDVLIPWRLDIWRQGRFQRGSDLFREKTTDLRGQVLQAVTFQHLPGTIKTSKLHDENGEEINTDFEGLEVEVLKTLSSVMNFIPKIYEAQNADEEQWGKKGLNGSFSGLIGEVVSGRADIALGNLHYTPYHLNLMDLTKPYITECITFLTPEILTDNSWMTLILPFKANMWTAVILTLFVVGFIFYILAKTQCYYNIKSELLRRKSVARGSIIILQKSENNTNITANNEENVTLYDKFLFGELNNGILYTYSMLLLVSLPKLPIGWPLRVLTGWWWLYCILVVVAYRASMTAILAHPAPRITIDTLDQLADSYIRCGGWGEQNKDFFLTSLDSAGQKIGHKFEVVYDTYQSIAQVAAGEFAYYDNIYFLQAAKVNPQVVKSTDSENNITEDSAEVKIINTNFHIMAECAINMPISIGLQKNSPLKLQMDKYIQRVVEAGLVKKWLKDVMIKKLSTKISVNDSNTKALMNLKKLYGALVALGIGYLISICVLICENIYWRCVDLKNPTFNKYYRFRKLNFKKALTE